MLWFCGCYVPLSRPDSPHGEGKYNTHQKQMAVVFATGPSHCSQQIYLKCQAPANTTVHFYVNLCAAIGGWIFLAFLRLHKQIAEEFLAYYMGAVRSCPHFPCAIKSSFQMGCFCLAHFQDHIILNIHLNFIFIHVCLKPGVWFVLISSPFVYTDTSVLLIFI